MIPERSFASFAIVNVAADGFRRGAESVLVGYSEMWCKLNTLKCVEVDASILVPWQGDMSWHYQGTPSTVEVLYSSKTLPRTILSAY